MNLKDMPFSRLVRLTIVVASTASSVLAQQKLDNPVDKFRQLEEILPTPNDQRTASGAPGFRNWQQRAEYVIDA